MNTLVSQPFKVQILDHDVEQGNLAKNLVQKLGFICEYNQHAPELLARLPADSQNWACVLLDVRLPYYSGVELQKLLQQHDSSLPIIFMGNERDIHVAIKVFKAGAHDFLLKPLDEQMLLETINHSLRHRQKNLHEQIFLSKIKNHIENLSNREAQVLDNLLEGMSNKNIAAKLSISSKTVEQHRANIMRKMNADSFAELVTNVVKYNLINQ